MTKRIVILVIILGCFFKANAEGRYFSGIWISAFRGFQNICSEKITSNNHLDFLNYVYTQNNKADYNYFQVAVKLCHADNYQVNAEISIYNNLVPYAYNVSFNYLLNRKFGFIAGSMSNQYYLTEFNDFYTGITDKNISVRYIKRQWKFSLLSFYFGPAFQIRYNTIQLLGTLKTGMTTFLPFNQRNIIKENLSNYKMVYDYQSTIHFSSFIMPSLSVNIDFLEYRKIILGGQFSFSYFFTRNSINYDLKTYEWTYKNPYQEKVKLSAHAFLQSDWNFGIYFRW